MVLYGRCFLKKKLVLPRLKLLDPCLLVVSGLQFLLGLLYVLKFSGP